MRLLTVAVLLNLGLVAEGWGSSDGPAFEVSYSRAGCSTSPVSAYRESCQRKLTPKAVRECVKKGQGDRAVMIADSFEFDGGEGGACSTAPGRFISFACAALFRCENAATAETELDFSCTSSMWCFSHEHCLKGQCVPKNAFNRCFSSFDCSFPDRCVGGYCG